jgi:hypothetical protein
VVHIPVEEEGSNCRREGDLEGVRMRLEGIEDLHRRNLYSTLCLVVACRKPMCRGMVIYVYEIRLQMTFSELKGGLSVCGD